LDLGGGEVAGGWRRLHNEELHSLYNSSHIIKMIKSWRVGWTGNAECMGERINAYQSFVGKRERRRPLEGLGTYG